MKEKFEEFVKAIKTIFLGPSYADQLQHRLGIAIIFAAGVALAYLAAKAKVIK